MRSYYNWSYVLLSGHSYSGYNYIIILRVFSRLSTGSRPSGATFQMTAPLSVVGFLAVRDSSDFKGRGSTPAEAGAKSYFWPPEGISAIP